MERAPDRLEEANHLRDFEHLCNTTREGSQAWNVFKRSGDAHLRNEHDVIGYADTLNRMKQLHLECHLREAFTDGVLVGIEKARQAHAEAAEQVLRHLRGEGAL